MFIKKLVDPYSPFSSVIERDRVWAVLFASSASILFQFAIKLQSEFYFNKWHEWEQRLRNVCKLNKRLNEMVWNFRFINSNCFSLVGHKVDGDTLDVNNTQMKGKYIFKFNMDFFVNECNYLEFAWCRRPDKHIRYYHCLKWSNFWAAKVLAR